MKMKNFLKKMSVLSFDKFFKKCITKIGEKIVYAH